MKKTLKKIFTSKNFKYGLQDERYSLLQWGSKRSIIRSLSDNKVYIVDNQHLMNLDERGLIL